jgi:hypothetical protein
MPVHRKASRGLGVLHAFHPSNEVRGHSLTESDRRGHQRRRTLKSSVARGAFTFSGAGVTQGNAHRMYHASIGYLACTPERTMLQPIETSNLPDQQTSKADKGVAELRGECRQCVRGPTPHSISTAMGTRPADDPVESERVLSRCLGALGLSGPSFGAMVGGLTWAG